MDELRRLANAGAALFNRVRGRKPAEVELAPPLPRSPASDVACLADLVAAYPDFLKGVDGGGLLWRDGARMPVRRGSPPRSPETILEDPDILDIFAWPYPLEPASMLSGPMGDPGRARPAAFFARVYGDCHRGEVQRQLVDVPWPGGHKVRFTRVNGADQALAAVARDLEKLGPSFAKYLWPTSGTFNCRPIAGTAAASMHAYGAAIDLASRYGAYWRWGQSRGTLLPPEIVHVFERHGFIWGGKWAHFDTFHFEYRPEIILAARRAQASGLSKTPA